MHSRTWTLMAAAGGRRGAGGAAETRVVADDAWCREERRLERRACGGIARCARRRGAAGARLTADARPNGGIQVKGWDRDEVRLRVRVTRHWRDTAEEARALAAQVRVETDGGDARDRTGEPGRRAAVVRRASAWTSRATPSSTCEADNGGIHLEDFAGPREVQHGERRHPPRPRGRPPRGHAPSNGGLHVNLSGSEWEGEGLDVRDHQRRRAPRDPVAATTRGWRRAR